jgi:hypothetical protein
MFMSNGNETISLDQFEWFFPVPPKPVFTITVTNERNICLSRQLCESVPSKLRIGIDKDGIRLGLVGDDAGGYRVPKSGVIKDARVVQVLQTRGIPTPARYLAEKVNDYWIATLIPSSAVPTQIKKTPRNPRKHGLGAMIQKKAK